MRLDRTRTPQELLPRIDRMFELSAAKIRALEQRWNPRDGAPVFTVEGRYATRGWTESSGRQAADIARQVTDWPLAALLYTDVAKDGMLQGPNFEHTDHRWPRLLGCRSAESASGGHRERDVGQTLLRRGSHWPIHSRGWRSR